MTDLDDKQKYKMPVPIKIPPGPPCPGCKKPVTIFGEMRARCMSCGLDFVDAFLRPKAQSDLEVLRGAFRNMGIPLDESFALADYEEGSDEIRISNVHFRFNDDGEFIGVYDSDLSKYTLRIPAPEH